MYIYIYMCMFLIHKQTQVYSERQKNKDRQRDTHKKERKQEGQRDTKMYTPNFTCLLKLQKTSCSAGNLTMTLGPLPPTTPPQSQTLLSVSSSNTSSLAFCGRGGRANRCLAHV